MLSFSETILSCLGINVIEPRVVQNASEKQLDAQTSHLERFLTYTFKMAFANGNNGVGASAEGECVYVTKSYYLD